MSIGPQSDKLPRKMRKLITSVTLATFLISSGALSDCEFCRTSSLEAIKARKSIQRLSSIIQINQDFISTLDPEDESERLKAKSNINIAKKRTAALETDLKVRHKELGTPACRKCGLEGDLHG